MMIRRASCASAGAGLLASASVVAVNLEPHDFPHLPPTAVYLYPVVPIVVASACAARWGGQLYYAAATFGALVSGAGWLAGVPATAQS